MKYILLLSVFISTTLCGQDTIRNFKIVGKEVAWQHVYQTKLSAFDVLSNLKAKMIFDKVDIIDSAKFSGKIKSFDPDLKGAGYSEWTSPVYLSRNTYSGNFTLEYLGGKYLVTVSQMFLTQKYDEPESKIGETLPVEKIAFNREGSFSAGFIKSPATVLDHTLTRLFDLDKPILKK